MEDATRPNSYNAPLTWPPRSLSMAEQTSRHAMGPLSTMHFPGPMAMWAQTSQPSSDLSAMSMMPQSQSHQHNAALSMMLQSQGLHFYEEPDRMFPPPMPQQQNSHFYNASIACSKRFSEEEKQKLEKVFTDETQKPSTSRKRQLAEELGCPVPKVNNWFQNRRAKEKQLQRVQAFEASQAAGEAVANDGRETMDDENEDEAPSELDNQAAQGLKPSSAPFTEADDSDEGDESPSSHDGQESDSFVTEPPSARSEDSSDESKSDILALAYDAEIQNNSQIQDSNLDVSLDSAVFEDQHDVLSSSPETYSSSHEEQSLDAFHDNLSSDFTSLPDFSGMGTMNINVTQAEYFPVSASSMAQNTPTITTDFVQHHGIEESCGRQNEISDFSSFDSMSPDIINQDSPTLDQKELMRNSTFPNSSIASRRKTRPPQRLNSTALRNYPNGPKTGIEGPRRPDLYGTMRRAASANGPLSGKIMKSYPPASPLSPRSFDPSFLEHLARASSLNNPTPHTYKETSIVSPMAPNSNPRYLSAENAGLGVQRSSSLSVNSLGETMALSPSRSNFARGNSFSCVQTHNLQHYQHPTFTSDTGCGNVSSEEGLTTPGLSQFGSELEFPTSLSAPRYVESEPATPSYIPDSLPQSSAAQGHGCPTLKIETPPQSDIYPWSRSPDRLPTWDGPLVHFGDSQSNTFQFQPNITPQNFNSPGQV